MPVPLHPRVRPRALLPNPVVVVRPPLARPVHGVIIIIIIAVIIAVIILIIVVPSLLSVFSVMYCV